MAKLYLGISGYAYKEWQGAGLFYPPELKAAKFLSYYASRYNSLESIGTSTHMPSPSMVDKWDSDTPDGFRFAPKIHQDVTHRKRLKTEAIEIAKTFVENLVPLRDKGKLGPILIQLPPNFKRNDELLKTFLSDLPDGFEWAVEFRNATWNETEVESILRNAGVSWVSADTDEEPAQRRDTANSIYVRLRKLEYDDPGLVEWSEYIRSKLAQGKDCYVFCRHKDVAAPWEWADRISELLNDTRPASKAGS